MPSGEEEKANDFVITITKDTKLSQSYHRQSVKKIYIEHKIKKYDEGG